MTEKTITGWLVVDWKSGQHRTRKSKPSHTELGNNELLAKIKVHVTVPKVDVPTLAVDIDVPEPQVHAAALEALADDELPDWTDAVRDSVEQFEERIREADRADLLELRDVITTRALLEINTRPDPNRVRDYVDELVYRLADGEEVAAIAGDSDG